jgi:formate-dependent nitrite reductase membrane component NrfD
VSTTRPDGDSYYGRPIIKEPTWTWEIPAYLFTGGLGGASATLSLAARLARRPALARTAALLGAAGDTVSLPLLMADLGRPRRFANMLRVVKPTSPMNVGSWILALSTSASSTAAALELTGLLPRARVAAGLAAGLAGPGLATYTGVLFADTAVPVWHEARLELPALFGASALATAGAAAAVLAPAREAGPARRLAILGAAGELAAARAMERRLGFVGEVYRAGRAGAFARAARALTAAGAGVLALAGRRSRRATRAGAALVLAGGLCTRWSVYSAGFASARDPRYTVHVQRERLKAAG